MKKLENWAASQDKIRYVLNLVATSILVGSVHFITVLIQQT